MVFVETVVNLPIRRAFFKGSSPPAPPPEEGETLQSYHYHLPPELEEVVQPGHLVWAPFGAQQVQAVVLRRTATAPVQTRPILRLARPEPVLTRSQIALAAWIAETYVAPFASALHLLLPPGLFSRHSQEAAVQARRELRVQLALPAADARHRLQELGRPTEPARVLAWLLASDGQPAHHSKIMQQCALRTPAAIRQLARQGVLENRAQEHVALALDPQAALQLLLTLRGASQYVPVVEALIDAGGTLWRKELNARAACSLEQLRRLASAGILTLHEELFFRDPLAGRTFPTAPPPALTSEQADVWQQLVDQGFCQPPVQTTFLLHGVTGSGKTEIYLRAIENVRQRGQQAIVLVPEIALTPQTVARFAGRFPGQVTVIHSGLTPGERYDVWRALRQGRFLVAVGPRSALFAPMPNLGLIVVDEEHESTYKQDAEEWGSGQIFYDARTVARHIAAETGCLLLYGSATPSLETYLAAQNKEIALLEMGQRVIGHRANSSTSYMELPPVEIVDMRQELRAGNRSLFSRSLAAQLQETLANHEQAILFLNRRGTHPFVLCRDCGYVVECKQCAIPLTYHSQNENRPERLVCHHCSRTLPVPTECPACQSKRIRFFGAGTERLVAAVQEILPAARILRWDADTTSRKGSHEQLLQTFAEHQADILIGTQMIAKGLDLPLVTLVGVVAADLGLFLPDFRSGERTFQLLTQVAGRAGRSERGGRVIVQSYRPDHYVVQAAARHDYAGFFARELAFRREHGYPPLRRLARLLLRDTRLERVRQESRRMAELLRQRLTALGLVGSADLLGPAPAFFERHRGHYRWQLLLRAPDPAAVLRGLEIPLGWHVDIDPLSLL